MKIAGKLFTPLLLIAVMTGCAQFLTPVTTRTIVVVFPPKVVSQGDVIEDAIDVGRELKFPPATKIDKAIGIVAFGDFGKPMMGITAQARVKSEGQLEVTVTRWSEFVPVAVDAPIEEFKTKMETLFATAATKKGK